MSKPTDTRLCPFCSIQIESTANACPHCGRFSKSTALAVQRRPSLPSRWNARIARWEAASPLSSCDRLAIFAVLEQRSVRAPIGTALLALAVFSFATWLHPYADWFAFRGGLSLTILACLMFFGEALVRSTDLSCEASICPPPDTAIRVYGYDINLAFVQSMCVVAILFFAYRWELGKASLAAASTVALAIPLHRTQQSKLSKLLAVVAGGYLMFAWSVVGSHSFPAERMAANHYLLSEMLVSPMPYIYAMAAIAVFPPLQILGRGNFRIGCLRGDFHIKAFGSHIPVAITSAILVFSIIRSVVEIARLRWHIWQVFSI